MTRIIRWGILGTGYIAHLFARGLQAVADAQLMAVGSRTREAAEAFGTEFNVPHRYASYEEVAHDADVDVVYIATPHNFHKDNAIMCLQAYKSVLCEKPFTLNAAEAQQVIHLARENGMFLMEAMWARFFPVMVKVRDLLAAGAIGEVMLVQADFGFRTEVQPEHRLFNPALAGGALLDVGIYPVSLISMAFFQYPPRVDTQARPNQDYSTFGRQPQRIATLTHLGTTGVDELSGMLFAYDHNQMGVATTALRVDTPHEARICGSEGRIHIPDFWHPTQLTLIRARQPPQTFDFPLEGNGYNYQAVAVGECLREGKLESTVMPLDETLAIMQTMDKIRAEWGLRYPGES